MELDRQANKCKKDLDKYEIFLHTYIVLSIETDSQSSSNRSR